MGQTGRIFWDWFHDYFRIFYFSLIHPKRLSREITKVRGFKKSLFFFVTNTVLAMVLRSFIQVIYFKKSALFSLSLPEILVVVPLSFTLLLISSYFFYILAKIMGGKGKYILNLKAIAYSNGPIVLFFIPNLKPVSFLFMVITMIMNFQRIHKFSLAKSVVAIGLPVTIFIAILFGLQFISPLDIIP